MFARMRFRRSPHATIFREHRRLTVGHSAMTSSGNGRFNSAIPALVNLFLSPLHSEARLLRLASSANPASVIPVPQRLSDERFSTLASSLNPLSVTRPITLTTIWEFGSCLSRQNGAGLAGIVVAARSTVARVDHIDRCVGPERRSDLPHPAPADQTGVR